MLQHLRAPCKGLIGPWLHDMPHVARPGPQIDHLREMRRWWDYWLKGIQNGVMDEPKLTAWVQGSRSPDPYRDITPGHWRSETEWPVARTDYQTWYLGPAGTFGLQPPPDTPPISWQGPPSPGLAAPFWCTGPRPGGLPRDQRRDDACSLTFTTPPLSEPLEILGFPRLELYLAASEPVAQLAVKLCDVGPDGSSLLVTRGVLNLTHRDSHAQPTPLVPGRVYPVRLELSSICHVFAPGRRLRLSLAGADWPLVWPPPRPTSLSLYYGATHPSRLVLPVIPARSPALPAPVFALPEVPAAPVRSEDTERAYTVRHDMVDGTSTLSSRVGGTSFLTEQGLRMTETNAKDLSLRDGDPLSCTAQMRRHLEWERTAWKIVIDSTITLSCTAQTFLAVIELQATYNDTLIFSRRWREEFPRVLG